MSTSTNAAEIGIVVDAGSGLGYGHAVRCVRLARALSEINRVMFYPVSAACKDFVEAAGFQTAALPSLTQVVAKRRPSVPSVVITDLRESHGATAAIRRLGRRHISIHDLGLAQCQSDVAIDGSVTTLFPWAEGKRRELFVGPQYMITREAAPIRRPEKSVLVTFGGGSTARFAAQLSDELSELGFTTIATQGFLPGSVPMTDRDFTDAMSSCSFAISGSGVTLYDLLASGVPTIAVAFDPLQLRTAEAFHELGAVLSAGLVERISLASLMRCCKEMLENHRLIKRITETGQMLVDGKGLSRVVDIVRRQLWLTSHTKTCTAC